jgi:TonB family protein
MPLIGVMALSMTILAQASPKAQNVPFFVLDHALAKATWSDDTLRLKPGPGWLRTRQVYGDFVFTANYRLEDEKAHATIGIRELNPEWPTEGYFLTLSSDSTAGQLMAKSRRLTQTMASALHQPPAAGAWHGLVISVGDRKVSVAIDGEVTGVYEVQRASGSLYFDVADGWIELRDIAVGALPIPPDVRPLKTKDGTPGFVRPTLTHEVRPKYTREAMRRKAKGIVELRAVVEADGSVSRISITRFTDPDLDQMAVVALQQWTFEPATDNGVPVPCLVEIEMTFTL